MTQLKGRMECRSSMDSFHDAGCPMTTPDNDLLPPSPPAQEHDEQSKPAVKTDGETANDNQFSSEVAMRLHVLGKLIIPPPVS